MPIVASWLEAPFNRNDENPSEDVWSEHWAKEEPRNMTLPYPPPFQDLATLAEHTGLSGSTIERRVKLGTFPPPCNTDGKRIWEWKKVYRYLAGSGDAGAPSKDDEARRIREATRAAANRSH